MLIAFIYDLIVVHEYLIVLIEASEPHSPFFQAVAHPIEQALRVEFMSQTQLFSINIHVVGQ